MGSNTKNTNNSIEKTIANAYLALDKITEKIADGIVCSMEEKLYEDVFSFDSCISFCNENMKRFPVIVGFVLSVKRVNTSAKGDTRYIITQGLIDRNDRPVTSDGKNPICRIIHARDVDEKTINYLNGDEIRMFTVK